MLFKYLIDWGYTLFTLWLHQIRKHFTVVVHRDCNMLWKFLHHSVSLSQLTSQSPSSPYSPLNLHPVGRSMKNNKPKEKPWPIQPNIELKLQTNTTLCSDMNLRLAEAQSPHSLLHMTQTSLIIILCSCPPQPRPLYKTSRASVCLTQKCNQCKKKL